MSPNLRNIHNGFGIELRACSCVKFLREQIAAKREQIAVKRELDWTPEPQFKEHRWPSPPKVARRMVQHSYRMQIPFDKVRMPRTRPFKCK